MELTNKTEKNVLKNQQNRSGESDRHKQSRAMMNIAAIISLIVNLSLVLAQNKECPKYLSLRDVKYRFVADGTGFSTCLGDIPHCVYTREMKFY